MQIKTYIASCVSEAMDQIRKDFGDEAVILSNQATQNGVRLTVGIESTQTDEEITQALFGSKDNQVSLFLRHALQKQSVPDLLIEKILTSIKEEDLACDDKIILTRALQRTFQFSALSAYATKRAFMLVGPNGCGKTIAVAKMAVRAKILSQSVVVITTDMKRAGGIEQLEAFTKILEVPLLKISHIESLQALVNEVRSKVDLVVIDTPGVNPFLKKDISFLQQMKQNIVGVEPILVLSAGVDANDSCEMAEAFLKIGCSRLMATRLDLSRRIGNILFSAERNGYALTDVGLSPLVSESLCPIKAESLAELILLNVKKEDVL